MTVGTGKFFGVPLKTLDFFKDTVYTKYRLTFLYERRVNSKSVLNYSTIKNGGFVVSIPSNIAKKERTKSPLFLLLIFKHIILFVVKFIKLSAKKVAVYY